ALFAKNRFASSTFSMSEKYAVPWGWLPPDFRVMDVTPPWVWPTLASKLVVCTLNSWTTSDGGVQPAIRSAPQRLFTATLVEPSSVISLRLARTPSMEYPTMWVGANGSSSPGFRVYTSPGLSAMRRYG